MQKRKQKSASEINQVLSKIAENWTKEDDDVIAKATKGELVRQALTGVPHSPDRVLRAVEARRLRGNGTISDKTKAKISLSQRGNTYRRGKVASDETKKRMSESSSVKRAVSILGKVYPSAKKAAEELNINKNTLRSRIYSKKIAWKEYYYLDCPKDPATLEQHNKQKRLSINGILYHGPVVAATALGLDLNVVYSRIRSKHEKWKDWFYKD